MANGIDLIVVGMDKSETAKTAADIAANLAKLSGAKLHIVTALHGIKSGTVSGPGGEQFFVDDAVDARAYFTGLAAHWPDLQVDVTVGEGKPAEVITQEAERLGADLIVVGNKRMHGITGRVLGAVANDVAHKAHCDVYIAHTT